jgi:hypothetical protein
VKFTFNKIAAEVPYSVIVKALNLAGCGEEQQIYCFTQEGRKQDIVYDPWNASGGRELDRMHACANVKECNHGNLRKNNYAEPWRIRSGY